MIAHSKYDRFPCVAVTGNPMDCAEGWCEIGARLRQSVEGLPRCVVAVECYPGVDVDAVESSLAGALHPALCIRMEPAFLGPTELDRKFADCMGSDPVFAMLRPWTIRDFFAEEALALLQRRIAQQESGLVLVIGVGATLVAPQADLLLYADLARWEIQRRQRLHLIGNLGAGNHAAAPAALYKRAFFIDWRAADRLKQEQLRRLDFLLDTNRAEEPKLIAGDLFRRGLDIALTRPFRVVPFFDPGPWGGHWMKEQFELPDGPPNYAWCFDCVPEENSLLLGFGDRRVEIPALDLVLFDPERLLGHSVYKRFGAEFPIRFDYLDTLGGGNLSLQVHPLKQYISEHFGLDYTQDESYYMMQAASDAIVYLGLREGVDREEMSNLLYRAQADAKAPFPAEKFVNIWPAHKHDHFLIPAGTVHCSGRNGVVLEISATPYIFTFKLWDWGRLGLNGKPRPIHLEHGLKNIQWNRTTGWVRSHLVNRVVELASGEGWREERTGLHEYEFIETRRHWFTARVEHNTNDTVNVLNLVEGEEALVESPSQAFEPFPVHYGETFIVPAAVGDYTVRPAAQGSSRPLATLKAFIREESQHV